MNKRVIVCLLVALTFSLVPIVSQARESVITIYFAGTGAELQWYRADQSKWKHHSELLSSLYVEQLAPAGQLKWFVNGVGTGCGDNDRNWFGNLADMLASGAPGLNLCRGWKSSLDDATGFLHSFAQRHNTDSILLNLVGWSRGAILAMRLAHDLGDYDQIRQINILAFDPVVGDLSEMNRVDHYTLGPKVKNYIGFYALHERSLMFSPTLPGYDSKQTFARFILLPGAHETMVGNLFKTGHSIISACYAENPACRPFGIGVENPVEPDLAEIYQLVNLFSRRLLMTPEWGGVGFDREEDHREEEWIARAMNRLWQRGQLYQHMQSFAMTPGGLENMPDCGKPFADGQSEDRCTLNYEGGVVATNKGLTDYAEPLSADLWRSIMDRTAIPSE